MRPTRRRLLIALVLAGLVAMALAPAALAAAGGGTAGFNAGGGGGGGFGGGGSGHAFFVFLIFRAIIDLTLATHGIFLLVLLAIGAAWWIMNRGMPSALAFWSAHQRQGRAHRRESRRRERRVELAAAEAEDENPIFGPSAVREAAAQLFADIQSAWSADDRVRLRGLVTAELLVEWERRLDDFERRGWRNVVEPVGPPKVEYVGLVRRERGHDDLDRVVVRLEAKLRDYVVDSGGRRIKREGAVTESVRMREYWTLERRGEHWVLASIESGAEGEHALKDRIVQTHWADEGSLRDEALVSGAVAESAPADVRVAELADLQFSGDARAAALDLSLADGRFAPDILEVAARRVVTAWTEAVDGPDAELRKVATPEAVRELLHPGDPSGRTRLVVRGAHVERIRIVGLDAAAEPPSMTLDVDLRGRRYIEDRDTTRVLAGSSTRLIGFTERWQLALTDDAAEPWRIVAVQTPAVPA
ncbi:MAG TPA: TIM44-like domain-containing protein [Solirubrobacteraceae bacterium]|nr:TIM44-like domain-containing protein [Solirubrobacteraceae bacterium]